MEEILPSKDSQGVHLKGSKNSRMKLYCVQNFNIEILLRFLVVAFKKKRKC